MLVFDAAGSYSDDFFSRIFLTWFWEVQTMTIFKIKLLIPLLLYEETSGSQELYDRVSPPSPASRRETRLLSPGRHFGFTSQQENPFHACLDIDKRVQQVQLYMKSPLRPPRRGEQQQPACHKQPHSNHAPLDKHNPFMPHSDNMLAMLN